MIDCVDEEPHFDGAVCGRAARRDAEEIALAVHCDGPITLDGTSERTRLAAESNPLEGERTARSAGHDDAPLLDGKMGDRHRVRIEGECPLPPLPRLRGRGGRGTERLGVAESKRDFG